MVKDGEDGVLCHGQVLSMGSGAGEGWRRSVGPIR